MSKGERKAFLSRLVGHTNVEDTSSSEDYKWKGMNARDTRSLLSMQIQMHGKLRDVSKSMQNEVILGAARHLCKLLGLPRTYLWFAKFKVVDQLF